MMNGAPTKARDLGSGMATNASGPSHLVLKPRTAGEAETKDLSYKAEGRGQASVT